MGCGCYWFIIKTLWYHQGPISIPNKTSYRNISWSLAIWIIASLWKLTGTSAAMLPRCLSNFNAIVQFLIPISRLRDFVIFYNKTSYRILKQWPRCYLARPADFEIERHSPTYSNLWYIAGATYHWMLNINLRFSVVTVLCWKGFQLY